MPQWRGDCGGGVQLRKTWNLSSYSSSSAAVGSNGSTRGGSSASTAAAPMRPGIRPQRIAAQDVRLRRRLDRRIAAAVRPQSLLIPDIIEHGYDPATGRMSLFVIRYFAIVCPTSCSTEVSQERKTTFTDILSSLPANWTGRNG